ncbi:MAG: M48 family metalloprotease [Burkholderiaceae bacterium]|jgi:predicted Zn-dependent protease|nr:M48 family metalloprotease [Burkholderiaceae bacterium]
MQHNCHDKKKLHRFFRVCLFPLLLMLAVQPPLYAQYGNLPDLGDTARGELSPKMEYKLGTEIMQRVKADPDYVKDGLLIEYLNNLGSVLVSASPGVRGEMGYDFFFFAVRDPTLNAFALPGGFIGVHTGLLLATQSESELASVLAHEIGHVSQRHIARMIGQQKQDMLVPIAAILLGALVGVASKSSDAAGAIVTGGQGWAIQRQLNFSREAESEADRIGFQILRDAGFDTNGMVQFFGRLQRASRAYAENPSLSYLRTHPLTTDRIADIQGRVRSEHYRQHADNPDFSFIRIRARLLQDNQPSALDSVIPHFSEQIQRGDRVQAAAGHYGMALVAMQKGEWDKANRALNQARKTLGEKAVTNSLVLASTAIEIKFGLGRKAEALQDTSAAIQRFPASRVLSNQYARALLESGKHGKAAEYLRKQAIMYRADPAIHNLLARVYGAQNKIAMMHMELAEAYHLSGGLSAALEQLRLARAAPDATFYDNSIIDAREREWRRERVEEMKNTK